MARERARLVIVILAVLVGVPVIVAIFIPPICTYTQSMANERNATTSLKSLCYGEADFRLNDRDGNGVVDYWTGDVKGLYTMTSAKIPGAGVDPEDYAIKLIDRREGAADADPTLIPAGGENVALQTFAPPAAKYGYWYAALTSDRSVKGPDAVYRQDTGGTPRMGPCHHLSRFGFMAFPDTSSSGKYIFLVNENNTIFRTAVTAPARTGSTVPPGLTTVPAAYLNWPDDATLKTHWGKLD